MVENDLVAKIIHTVSKNEDLEEADVRSLMVLMRKLLDQMPQPDQQSFLILRLFANWSVHVSITKSNIGLRILSSINNALVTFKSADTDILRKSISGEIGFRALRKEVMQFLDCFGIDHTMVIDNTMWAIFIKHLIEIIRDVPLSFPPISTLNNAERRIYDQITRNPIKPGAGVVAIRISIIDYAALGAKDSGKQMCLVIKTEDTTTIVVPLLIEMGQ